MRRRGPPGWPPDALDQATIFSRDEGAEAFARPCLGDGRFRVDCLLVAGPPRGGGVRDSGQMAGLGASGTLCATPPALPGTAASGTRRRLATGGGIAGARATLCRRWGDNEVRKLSVRRNDFPIAGAGVPVEALFPPAVTGGGPRPAHSSAYREGGGGGGPRVRQAGKSVHARRTRVDNEISQGSRPGGTNNRVG